MHNNQYYYYITSSCTCGVYYATNYYYMLPIILPLSYKSYLFYTIVIIQHGFY